MTYDWILSFFLNKRMMPLREAPGFSIRTRRKKNFSSRKNSLSEQFRGKCFFCEAYIHVEGTSRWYVRSSSASNSRHDRRHEEATNFPQKSNPAELFFWPTRWDLSNFQNLICFFAPFSLLFFEPFHQRRNQYCFFAIFMSKELLDDTIVFRVKTSSWQASWGSYQLSQKHPILRKFRKFLHNLIFFLCIFMSSKEVLDSTSVFSVVFKWVWSTTKKWESPWEWFSCTKKRPIPCFFLRHLHVVQGGSR